MKLSVVTISFNQAHYLRSCIDSVLAQRDIDLEYIIVDPGSTDNSRQIIDSYDDTRIIRVYETDQGPADGLNIGFRHATGAIYGFINSDDYLLPNALSIVSSSFATWPQLDVVCGNALQVDGAGNFVRKLYSTPFSARKFAYGVVNVVQPATFFRRIIFEEVGGFNQKNKWFWDGELFVRMAQKGAKFGRVADFLAVFRVYRESISGGAGDYSGYLLARRRLREEILGRKYSINDSFLSFVYKVLKLVSCPTYTWSAITGAIRTSSRKFRT